MGGEQDMDGSTQSEKELTLIGRKTDSIMTQNWKISKTPAAITLYTTNNK